VNVGKISDVSEIHFSPPLGFIVADTEITLCLILCRKARSELCFLRCSKFSCVCVCALLIDMSNYWADQVSNYTPHNNTVEWRLGNNIVPYKYLFTVYFCDIRSAIANTKFCVATDLEYVCKFCLMIFCGQGYTSLIRIQAFFILFEHFKVMNVSVTKTLVQRWTYKWKLFSQVVTIISDEPFASIFPEK
jgi:hypothetical protein